MDLIIPWTRCFWRSPIFVGLHPTVLRSYILFFFFGRRPLRLRSPRVRLHTGTRFTHGLLDPPGLQLSTPRLGLGEPRAADDYRPVSRTRSGEVRGGVWESIGQNYDLGFTWGLQCNIIYYYNDLYGFLLGVFWFFLRLVQTAFMKRRNSRRWNKAKVAQLDGSCQAGCGFVWRTGLDMQAWSAKIEVWVRRETCKLGQTFHQRRQKFGQRKVVSFSRWVSSSCWSCSRSKDSAQSCTPPPTTRHPPALSCTPRSSHCQPCAICPRRHSGLHLHWPWTPVAGLHKGKSKSTTKADLPLEGLSLGSWGSFDPHE